jgi:hypothetical protein
MMALWPVLGSLVGLANGLTRWWTVSRLGHQMPRRALALVWGGLILRLALVTALLIPGLRRSIVSGLLAFAGLWLARWATVIWFGAARRRGSTEPGGVLC